MYRKIRDLVRVVSTHLTTLATFAPVQTRVLQELYVQNLLTTTERYRDPKALVRFDRQLFSQNGEDGIIDEIFRRIGTETREFVEVGVHPLESNTTALLYRGWSGLWIDLSLDVAAFPPYLRRLLKEGRLQSHSERLTRDNVNGILEHAGVSREPDLISLDIDHNTYYLWEALEAYRPRAYLIEYNASIPPDLPWVVEYDPEIDWDQSNCFGAGLKSLEILGTERGYCLVGCELVGTNAFFVREDLVQDRFQEPFTAEFHYEPPRYFLMRRQGHQKHIGPSHHA